MSKRIRAQVKVQPCFSNSGSCAGSSPINLGSASSRCPPDVRLRLDQVFQRLYEAQYPAAPASPGSALGRNAELRRGKGTLRIGGES